MKDAAMLRDEAIYTCESCGEEIELLLDHSAGSSQEFVEDCPVCCRANVVHVEINENGGIKVWATAEIA
jgi:hypothetical protein